MAEALDSAGVVGGAADVYLRERELSLAAGFGNMPSPSARHVPRSHPTTHTDGGAPLRWASGSKWRQGSRAPPSSRTLLHLMVGEVRMGLDRGPPMTGLTRGSIIRESLCKSVFHDPARQ